MSSSLDQRILYAQIESQYGHGNTPIGINERVMALSSWRIRIRMVQPVMTFFDYTRTSHDQAPTARQLFIDHHAKAIVSTGLFCASPHDGVTAMYSMIPATFERWKHITTTLEKRKKDG